MAAFKVMIAFTVLLVILMWGRNISASHSTAGCTDDNCLTCDSSNILCEQCDPGFYLGATACEACDTTTCDPATEYTAQECDGVFNRLCKTCTTGGCRDGQFESVCNATSDRVCTACSCPENTYIENIYGCDESATSNYNCLECTDCAADPEIPLYAAAPCGVASNTECVPCSEGCGTGFYVSSPCNATADRICAVCSVCLRGTYDSGGCDGTVDTECMNCSTSCDDPGQFIGTPCDCDSDIFCTTCNECEDTVTFECAPCDGINDRQCKDCSTDTCPEGYYISSACNVTTDRQCSACGCPDGQYIAPESTCVPGSTANYECLVCSECSISQYVSASCNSDTNTVCESCHLGCGDGQYEISPCNGVTNRKCADCSGACPVGQYISAACSETADRQCSPCDACEDGYYKTADCTDTESTVCEPCDVCGDDQYETDPCDGVNNRQCAACDVCGDDQYETDPCDGVNNRQCADCTSCASGFVEKSPCTSKSNRVCQKKPTPTLLQLCKDKFRQGLSSGLRCRKVLCKNLASFRRLGFCGRTRPFIRPPIRRF